MNFNLKIGSELRGREVDREQVLKNTQFVLKIIHANEIGIEKEQEV